MNKLWVRLTVAFGLVTIMGVMTAAILANFQVDTQFRTFVMRDQMASNLAPTLAEYYARNGSWTGVEDLFGSTRSRGFGGPGRWHGSPFDITLIDASGQVIYANSGSRHMSSLRPQDLTNAVPIRWDNQTVGYLLSQGSGRGQLTAPAQAFLVQINRSLVLAGLIVGVLGVLAGLLIARGLAAPLGRLVTAARHISKGKLDQRVPEKGAEEIMQLARAFNDMAAGLQQAEKLRRNMVADIAHELRTPLSVIQGNLQAILDDVYPLDKAEIAAIYDETLSLNRLITDLHDLAQAEAGQLSLNLQVVDLSPLVTAAVDLFQELAREKQINMELTMPAGLPPALIDPDRTRQVLHNLLTNAIRYTPDGGEVKVEVEIQRRKALVRDEGRRRKDEEKGGHSPGSSASLPQYSADTPDLRQVILVSVSDTGPGIAPEDHRQVFNRFWRAEPSRSRELGGSGLGLAIAQQLIEAQGGHIGVESEGVPGQGSRFWFTLPVQ